MRRIISFGGWDWVTEEQPLHKATEFKLDTGPEITPQMVDAGCEAMRGLAHLADGDSPSEIVSEVYRAMEMASRQKDGVRERPSFVISDNGVLVTGWGW